MVDMIEIRHNLKVKGTILELYKKTKNLSFVFKFKTTRALAKNQIKS